MEPSPSSAAFPIDDAIRASVMSKEMNSPRLLNSFFIYLGILVTAVVAYLLIREYGEAQFGVTKIDVREIKESHQALSSLFQVLVSLVVVIAVARLVGAVFRALHQPPVIGEVIGGILLGPSFLGAIAPGFMSAILPTASAPFLGIIAQLGIILYMFIVGLELDLKLLRNSGHKTLMISHASIVVPFLMGAVLAIWLFPSFAPTGVGFTTFSLFLGVSLAITAFPVLARILTEKGLHKTPLGTLALTCAAIDDATAWCLLAFVTSVAQATILSAVSTILLTIAYIFFMFLLVKPLAQKGVAILEKSPRLSEGNLAIILLALLVSALATEFIGIHAIFGAFLLGAITPHDSRVASELTERLQDLVQVLFLPAFFAFTGMRTQVGLVSSAEDWKTCAVIIAVATFGKFFGTVAAARLCGVRWRESGALGILMNTRGLVELIVLNIGLDLGVISPRLFAMLVIMALVTTFMTGPALKIFIRDGQAPSTTSI